MKNQLSQVKRILTPGVYILHFDRPYHHARHYTGFAQYSVIARLEKHLKGQGSPLVKAAVEDGITVECVRVYPEADRSFERHLKRQKNIARQCPICNGQLAERRYMDSNFVKPGEMLLGEIDLICAAREFISAAYMISNQ